MKARRPIAILLISAFSIITAGCFSEAPTLTPPATPTPTDTAVSTEETRGHEIFISKGCAACHGQNAQGSEIAPALPGHSEATVKRQVRNPRFRMPAFTESQVGDEELDAIAQYIASLPAEGHAHLETTELTAAVEMHHWMALEALKGADTTEGAHHIQHIIDLLKPGVHRTQMEAILESLQAGETHDPQHEIEGMLAGTAAPELTLLQLHLKQALVALPADDLAGAQHHVAHAQELADVTQEQRFTEILRFLEQGQEHGAEHEIEQLLAEQEQHNPK